MTKISDIDLLDALAVEESKEDFWAYRQYVNDSKLKTGWWQRRVAQILQDFYVEMMEGKRPILVITAPPQHGKSDQVVDFATWIAGKNPDIRTIYTAFSDDLCVRANLKAQRNFDSYNFKKTFPQTRIKTKGVEVIGHNPIRTQSHLEFIGRSGYFQNTTVNGQITGKTIDLGIIDDPLKGRKEANSKTVRDSAWNWLTDDFMTRLSEMSGVIFIMTRWHHDDPLGRLLKKKDPRVKVFNFPAIATEDDEFRKVGEPLFPELKSAQFLQDQKEIFTPSSWEALYQQNPSILVGEIIKAEHWKFYKGSERPTFFQKVISSWDLTFDRDKNDSSKNDYVVGTVWGITKVNNQLRAYLLDRIKQKADFNEQIRMFVSLLNRNPKISKHYVEKAANGAALVTFLSQKIKNIEAVPVVGGDKTARWIAVTPFHEQGQVWIPDPKEVSWVQDYLNVHTEFPNGAHDDDCDSTSQALFQIFGEYKEPIDFKNMYS